MRAGITARGLRGFWGASHSIGRVGVSISARVGSQHSAEQAAGRAAKAMASASPPYYFSADFINQHQYTLAAPKALQARSRSPLARTARVSARRIGAGKRAGRDRAPGVRRGDEPSGELADDPAPTKCSPKNGRAGSGSRRRRLGPP